MGRLGFSDGRRSHRRDSCALQSSIAAGVVGGIRRFLKRGANSTGNSAFREECPYAQAYFSGNLMNGVEPLDPWSLVDLRISGAAQSTYKRAEPFPAGVVETETAAEAYQHVLAGVGAYPRDEVDVRVVEDVKNGTGHFIDSQDEVGGWPTLRTAPPPIDSNGDSIPDWWYVMYGFDPKKGLDPSGDLNGSGYTNIEEYLNGTDPDHYVDYGAD